MSIQQPLDLAFIRSPDWEDFVVGENDALITRLKHLKEHPPVRGLYLVGPAGSGKSLLLEIIQQFYQDTTVHCVCVDELESAIAQTGELDFFARFNLWMDMGMIPIFAARDIPSKLGLTLKDLESRLQWGEVFQVSPAPESAYPEILQKAALRAGMSLSGEIAQFLYTRVLRDLSALPSLIAILSQASLESQRRLTVPFVKEILGV